MYPLSLTFNVEMYAELKAYVLVTEAITLGIVKKRSSCSCWKIELWWYGIKRRRCDFAAAQFRSCDRL